MNPLERISAWLDTLSIELQNELIGLFSIFHPDIKVSACESDNYAAAFKEYLTVDPTKDVEIVRRALLSIGLIDIALSGRNTQSGWDNSVDLHLGVASRMQEKGISTDISNTFFETLNDRKKIWFDMDKSWESLKAAELSKSSIFDWWSYQVIEQHRKK